MSGMEETLRETLKRGNVHDVAFRKKVYAAAANALRKSLDSQANLTEQAVQLQKDRLADAIRSVEVELRDQQPMRVEVVKKAFNRDGTPAATPAPTPTSDTIRAEPRIEPKTGADVAPPIAADRKAGKGRIKRGTFARGFGTIAIAGLALVGLLWVVFSGAFTSQADRDTSVPNPPPSTSTDNFQPRDPGTSTAPALRSEADAQSDWITVFTPNDLGALTLTGGASADAASDPFGDYVRMITPRGGQVGVDLPVGPLRDLAGQRVQIELTAKSDELRPTEMSVTCDLGGAVQCPRVRFNVGQASEAFIFRLDLREASRIDQAGRLLVDTDIAGGEKAVKLLSVRVRAEGDS
ncbi:MAG: hypothetical protein AAFP99_00305 [Pseudomonadota bacterium]